MIANSGHDENGKYRGGKAGDQTGKEFEIRTWYKRPWNCVLRYPDPRVGIELADLARSAALNDRIGYDQNQRWTFLSVLRLANWIPGKIQMDCEADCSSGVITLTMAAGYRLQIDALKTINNTAVNTYTMRAGYRKAGFEVLTDSKYLTSDKYLLPGDILLNDNAHTAMNLDKGSAVTEAEKKKIFNSIPRWVGEVTASTLNVRSWAGTRYANIKTWPFLSKGNWIDVCDQIHGEDGSIWYYIRIYGQYYGFVRSDYIKPV